MCCPVNGWICTAGLVERAAVIYSLVLYSEDESYSLVRYFRTSYQNTEHNIEKKSPETQISLCHHNKTECTLSKHRVNTVSEGIL